jgi:hypothetical protein
MAKKKEVVELDALKFYKVYTHYCPVMTYEACTVREAIKQYKNDFNLSDLRPDTDFDVEEIKD